MEDEEIKQANEIKNAYYRKWRKEHKENVKKTQLRYWLKKANKQKEKQAKESK